MHDGWRFSNSNVLRHLESEQVDAIVAAKHLRVLHLNGAMISDDHLARIAAIPTLRQLSLAESAISTESLVTLASLSQLESLDLRWTQLTEAAMVTDLAAGQYWAIGLVSQVVREGSVPTLYRAANVMGLARTRRPLSIDTVQKLHDSLPRVHIRMNVESPGNTVAEITMPAAR